MKYLQKMERRSCDTCNTKIKIDLIGYILNFVVHSVKFGEFFKCVFELLII